MKRSVFPLLSFLILGGIGIIFLAKVVLEKERGSRDAEVDLTSIPRGDHSLLNQKNERSEGRSTELAGPEGASVSLPPSLGRSQEGSDSKNHETLIFELEDLAMDEDPAALRKILSHLSHSSSDVRLAAIEAAEQFGDASAVAALRKQAPRAVSSEEKARLLEAADFLSLPSLRDLLEEEQKAKINGAMDPRSGDGEAMDR